VHRDSEGCVITFDQAKEELEEIERKLARRQGIKRQVRRTLIEQIRNGTLVEDELVAQWHDAYSSYLDAVTARPSDSLLERLK
jgi:cytosine/adenosine deaminase-related metal-dependent hydrolase